MAEHDIPLSVFHFDCYWMRPLELVRLHLGPRHIPGPGGDARPAARSRTPDECVDQPLPRSALAAVRGGCARGLPRAAAGRLGVAVGHVGGGHGARRLHQPRSPRLVRRQGTRPPAPGGGCDQGGLRRAHPDGCRMARRLRPGAHAQLLQPVVQQDRVRGGRGRARTGRGGALRAVRDSRRSAVPRALGRRLRGDLRFDGRIAARRAVARDERLRVLEPRHRRLRGHPDAGAVRALAAVRSVLFPRAAARFRTRIACRGHSGSGPPRSRAGSPRIRNGLAPYLWRAAVEAHEQGLPVMRAMVLEFPQDPVVPAARPSVPAGRRPARGPVFDDARGASSSTCRTASGSGSWMAGCALAALGTARSADLDSLPVLVRPGSVIPRSSDTSRPDGDHLRAPELEVFGLADGRTATCILYDATGAPAAEFEVRRAGEHLTGRLVSGTVSGGWSLRWVAGPLDGDRGPGATAEAGDAEIVVPIPSATGAAVSDDLDIQFDELFAKLDTAVGFHHRDHVG